ncbi:hypothetical protein ACFVXQ_14530, partial [Kitasatospora sp. NPDC058263]
MRRVKRPVEVDSLLECIRLAKEILRGSGEKPDAEGIAHDACHPVRFSRQASGPIEVTRHL